MNPIPESRIDLNPSRWDPWRPFGGRVGLVALLCSPAVVAAVITQSTLLALTALTFMGVAVCLAIRGRHGAFATASHIHFRRGLLGLSSESLPIGGVDQVFVDPLLSLVPGLGTLTVQYGPRYLTFEAVRHAEETRNRLLALRDQARGTGRSGQPGLGGMTSQNKQMRRTGAAQATGARR